MHSGRGEQDYAAFFGAELHFRRIWRTRFTSLANVIVRDQLGEGMLVRQLFEYFSPHDDKGCASWGSDGRRGALEKRAPVPVLLKSPKRRVVKLLSGAGVLRGERNPYTAVLVIWIR